MTLAQQIDTMNLSPRQKEELQKLIDRSIDEITSAFPECAWGIEESAKDALKHVSNNQYNIYEKVNYVYDYISQMGYQLNLEFYEL